MTKELSKLFGETSLPENKEVHGSSILLNKERIEITYYERSKVEIDEEGYELPDFRTELMGHIFQSARESWEKYNTTLSLEEFEKWFVKNVDKFDAPLLSYTIDLVLAFKQKILTQQWENAMT